MSRRIQTTLLSAVLILTLSACDVNIVQGPAQPNFEMTITAQALVLQQGGQVPVAAPGVVNPPAANVGNPPAANNPNPAATNTPNPPAGNNANNPPATGPVTVTVSVETNCRSDPGLIYSSVYSMSVSDVAEVIGKNTLTNYWIIKIPNGSGATCWLWGQYATVKGNTAALPEFTTPTPKATATVTKTAVPTATSTVTSSPVPVLTKPNAPSGLAGTVICNASVFPNQFDYAISLTWVDNSNNENNFNIFTNSTLFPVSANTTSFDFTQTYPKGTTLTVSITAQNNAGSSAVSTTSFVCQ